MNTIERLNLAIKEFVLLPENAVLRPATGSYSTPFRGTLFGLENAQDVEIELGRQRVSVLFLGSNPNVPDSLSHIKAGSPGAGHWPEFERQSASGRFGQCMPDRSGRLESWDPLHTPESMGAGQKASWTFYAEAIRAGTGSLDTVAFANVFPWGSGKLDDFLSHLGGYDSGLLDRVIALADQQLSTMIEALRPDLVLCPLSVSKHKRLNNLMLAEARFQNSIDVSPKGLEKRPFEMRLATIECNRRTQTILSLNHPAALRFNRKVDRPAIAKAIADAVRQALTIGLR